MGGRGSTSYGFSTGGKGIMNYYKGGVSDTFTDVGGQVAKDLKRLQARAEELVNELKMASAPRIKADLRDQIAYIRHQMDAVVYGQATLF